MSKAILIAGLGFGDEGKGSIVDFLTRQEKVQLVVRYNGGAQAAHYVVAKDNIGKRVEHCFSQFGSGTLAGARTHLSKYMMVDPLALFREAEHLKEIGVSNPLDLLTIDLFTPIITPYHVAMNKLREIARGSLSHGSCGRGIGELGKDIANKEDVLQARDLWDKDSAKRAMDVLVWTQERLWKEALSLRLHQDTEENMVLFKELAAPPIQWLKKVWSNPEPNISSCSYRKKTVIFEGAQGVLLDEWHGFHPYTTWSDITFNNAITLLSGMGWTGDVTRVGVTRCYGTRHGAGPFPTEREFKHGTLIPDEHNTTGRWQGNFRVGHLDLVLLNYALRVVNGVDYIALTCLDQFPANAVATHYRSPIAGFIDSLPYLPDHNLVAQEKLGRFLSEIKINNEIIYHHYSSEQDLYQLLENKLRTPIGIRSFGPTAEDKEYIYDEFGIASVS